MEENSTAQGDFMGAFALGLMILWIGAAALIVLLAWSGAPPTNDGTPTAAQQDTGVEPAAPAEMGEPAQ